MKIKIFIGVIVWPSLRREGHNMYFSKKLNDSMQFYYDFQQHQSFDQYVNFIFYVFPLEKLPKHLHKKYEGKINALSHKHGSIYGVQLAMLELTKEERNEIINLIFREHINRWFNDQIHFYDELLPIIFCEDNAIRLLDESVFQMIKYYTAKFYVIDTEAINAVNEHSKRIKDGLYSNGIKKLSSAFMHESEVTFEIKEPYIIANFGMALHHCPMKCKFHAIFDDSLKVFDCEINESEVLINDNGTFQYNAVVYTPRRCQNVSEIKITFYDVEVEELGYGGEDSETGAGTERCGEDYVNLPMVETKPK